MARNNIQEMKELSMKVAKENSLYFIEDIVAYIPISKPTFYDYFKVNSDDFNDIKEILDNNRIITKVSMRKKWEDSDNATLQIGLMKLISTDEEAHRLNGTRHENKMSGHVNIKPKEWI